VLGKSQAVAAMPNVFRFAFAVCFSLATSHWQLATRHSPPPLALTHFSPVNFYCGHYGSSPRKTKGTSQTQSSQTKKRRRSTGTTPSAVSLLSSVGFSLRPNQPAANLQMLSQIATEFFSPAVFPVFGTAGLRPASLTCPSPCHPACPGEEGSAARFMRPVISWRGEGSAFAFPSKHQTDPRKDSSAP
jgi:hypothetical protein